MTASTAEIAAAFERQSDLCRSLGADLTSSVIDTAALCLREAGPLAKMVDGFDEDPGKAALALRVAGAAQYLHIKGRAGAFSPHLRGLRAFSPTEALGAFAALAEAEEAVFRLFISRPPQTNEINRIAVLLPAFSEVSRRFDLPIDLFELGASGGLLLAPDRCRVDYGRFSWGDGPVRLSSEWRGSPPPLAEPLDIRGRFGCDRNPLDFSDPEQRDMALSYIWPEHSDRRETFQSALASATAADASVDRADAIDWLSARAIPRSGAVCVVFTSVFAVYLDGDKRAALETIVERTGARACEDAPFAFVQFEPEETFDSIQFNLDLTTWPGGERRRLAKAQSHGQWIEWMG